MGLRENLVPANVFFSMHSMHVCTRCAEASRFTGTCVFVHPEGMHGDSSAKVNPTQEHLEALHRAEVALNSTTDICTVR